MCPRVLIIGLALLGMSAFVEAGRRKQRKQASESAAVAQMAQCQAHKTCTACWRARCGWCTGSGFMPRCGVDSLDACDIDHLIGAAPRRIAQASCPEDPGSTAGWKVEKWARGHRHVGSGGWEEETVSADFENFTNGLGCNIDRRSVSSLSAADFEKEYYLPRKPVILTDVGVAGNAHSWARKAWTKEALRAHTARFQIGTPYDAQVHRRSVKMMTVEEFLDMLASQPDKARYMWSETNETQPPIGKHVGERVAGHEVSVMASLLPTPSELADSSTSDVWGQGKLVQFAMGATGSGIAFHAHKDGWCEVIYGTKLWWFYPPQTVAPLHNVFRAHIDWLAEAAVALPPEEQPMSCVQEAGEIMYVPEAWNHATINIGNTIALAQQRQGAASALSVPPILHKFKYINICRCRDRTSSWRIPAFCERGAQPHATRQVTPSHSGRRTGAVARTGPFPCHVGRGNAEENARGRGRGECTGQLDD